MLKKVANKKKQKLTLSCYMAAVYFIITCTPQVLLLSTVVDVDA